MKQIAMKTIKGKIEVVTGLHIGAGNDKVEIGGMDNPIIRNPANDEPYIPGSSIKGKMRSLMEWKLGVVDKYGETHRCKDLNCPICRVFGAANNKKDPVMRGPTRIIVRDALLTEEWGKKFDKGEPVIEEKNENSINRITAKATPRPVERVVPGAQFDFEVDYRVMDMGDGGKADEGMFQSVVIEGLRLLQGDFLGGGGSRGSGRIKFVELKDESANAIGLEDMGKKTVASKAVGNGTI